MRVRKVTPGLLNFLSVLLGIVFIYRLATGGTPSLASKLEMDTPVLQVGSKFPVEISRLSERGPNVVLAVQRKCSACIASMPFYRSVAQQVTENGGTLTLIGEEPAPLLKDWAAQFELRPSGVIQVPLAANVGLISSPTFIILTVANQITDLVVGQLSTAQQAAISQRLRRPEHTSPITNVPRIEMLTSTEAHALRSTIQLLDVRERVDVQNGEIPLGANRIPIDELASRAPGELAAAAIAIDCRETPVYRCQIAARTLWELGFKEVKFVRR